MFICCEQEFEPEAVCEGSLDVADFRGLWYLPNSESIKMNVFVFLLLCIRLNLRIRDLNSTYYSILLSVGNDYNWQCL